MIQRGRNEVFVLVAQNNAADEVLARVRDGLNEMLERKSTIRQTLEMPEGAVMKVEKEKKAKGKKEWIELKQLPCE